MVAVHTLAAPPLRLHGEVAAADALLRIVLTVVRSKAFFPPRSRISSRSASASAASAAASEQAAVATWRDTSATTASMSRTRTVETPAYATPSAASSRRRELCVFAGARLRLPPWIVRRKAVDAAPLAAAAEPSAYSAVDAARAPSAATRVSPPPAPPPAPPLLPLSASSWPSATHSAPRRRGLAQVRQWSGRRP